MAESRLYTRSLTSLTVMAGFLIMSVSGIVAFIVPEGRIAYWTEWVFLGLTKEQWGDIHILSSLIFLVAGAVHLWFNWHPMMNYMSQRAGGALKHRWELAITVVISLAVVFSAIYKIPPLSYLLDFNTWVKEQWVVSKDYEPPFGHAELLSLKVFAQKTNIPFEEAMVELAAKGLQVDPGKSLQEIARTNRTSPLEVYRLIRHLEVQPALAAPAAFTAEKVEDMFAGTGIGNKSIPDLAGQLAQHPARMKSRLAGKGIQVEDSVSLKQLATKHNTQPLELLKAALVDEYRPK